MVAIPFNSIETDLDYHFCFSIDVEINSIKLNMDCILTISSFSLSGRGIRALILVWALISKVIVAGGGTGAGQGCCFRAEKEVENKIGFH
jgi:hypothetical protein